VVQAAVRVIMTAQFERINVSKFASCSVRTRQICIKVLAQCYFPFTVLVKKSTFVFPVTRGSFPGGKAAGA
jgi:hypothetical protein